VENSAKLVLYNANTLEPLQIGDFGQVLNNSFNLLAISIKNEGTKPAYNVVAYFDVATDPITKKPLLGSDKMKEWLTLNYESSGIFRTSLELPDVMPGQFMPGYKVYTETFTGMTRLPEDWIVNGNWEAYSAGDYLHHLGGQTTGRAIPGSFPTSFNCEISVDIGVAKYGFGGVQLRMGDDGYGYLILVRPEPSLIDWVNGYYANLPGYRGIINDIEAVIEICKGRYNDNEWSERYWFPVGTGPRTLKDNFKIKLKDNTIEVWYRGNYIGKYVDPNPINRPGKMALIASKNVVITFDNLEYKIETPRGILFVKANVPAGIAPNVYKANLVLDYQA